MPSGAAAAHVQHRAVGRQVLLHHQVELVAARHPARPGGAVLLSVRGLGGVGKQGAAGHRGGGIMHQRPRGAGAAGLIDRLSVCYYAVMARTLDLELHTVRREAFVDVAQRLVQTKGYEAMSIQDLLDELERLAGRLLPLLRLQAGAARGGGRPLRRRRAGHGGARPRRPAPAGDPEAGAGLRGHRALEGGAEGAGAAIMEVWNSDGNAIVREKLRRD